MTWLSSKMWIAVLVFLLLPVLSAFSAEIHWTADIEQAWQTTKAQKRPLLVFVTASGCRYCQLMKRNTFADADVARQVNDGFVPVTVDADQSAALVERWQVTAYPTTIVISHENLVVNRIKGYVAPASFKQRLSEQKPSR